VTQQRQDRTLPTLTLSTSTAVLAIMSQSTVPLVRAINFDFFFNLVEMAM
jgi:hypothetical protein